MTSVWELANPQLRTSEGIPATAKFGEDYDLLQDAFNTLVGQRTTELSHVANLVGGVVAMGSATVLIGGLPAAWMTDQVMEAGGPNPIAQGATTVLIG